MKEIWTGERRRLLFRGLVERFGPFDSWMSMPPSDIKLEKYCSDFASLIGASSPRAVQHQIRFAMPSSSKRLSAGHARAAILNKAAALEVGFIRQCHIPDIVVVSRRLRKL